MTDFKLYKDTDLKEMVEDPIDLGKLKAGYSKKFTFYVYNSSVFPYEELEFTFDSSEISIVEAPEKIEEKQNAKLVVEWKPKVDIESGLKTVLRIEGYKVIN